MEAMAKWYDQYWPLKDKSLI